MILFVQIVCNKKTDVLKTSVFLLREINFSLAAERSGERVGFLQKSSAKNLSDEIFLIVLCVAVHSSAEHRRVCWANDWEL